MRLRQYLTELFSTKVNITIGRQQKDIFDASFVVGNYDYEFEAYNTEKTMGGYKVWDILFRRVNPMGMSEYMLTGDLDTKEVMAVFSGVKQAGELFLKKYKPDIFIFQAWKKEPKRVQMYKNLAKYISKWFPQYEYEGEIDFEESAVTFAWYKK